MFRHGRGACRKPDNQVLLSLSADRQWLPASANHRVSLGQRDALDEGVDEIAGFQPQLIPGFAGDT